MFIFNKSKRVVTAVVLGFVFSGQVFASPAGKVNLADLSAHYGEAKVEINLHSAMLSMVAAISAEEEPEFSALAAGIESINVRVYELKGDTSKALEVLGDITKKIRKDNWLPLVSVNEKDKKIRIFSKMTEGIMDGLIVMVVDSEGGNESGNEGDNKGGEAIFINIVGQIDPAKISTITKSLHINLGD